MAQTDREAVRTLLEHVSQHRLNHNWSQAKIVRRACFSRPAYQNFENGYGNTPLANLVRVPGVFRLIGNLAQLVPAVTEEPTHSILLKPVRRRARTADKPKISS